MNSNNQEPLVKMVDISKNFGKVRALKNVDFQIYNQEIVGLLGDNGAGKSTLIKTLIGVYNQDNGEIYFDGEKVKFSSPKEARERGIETAFQDLALIDLMSTTRNFFLGREVRKKVGLFRFLDMEEMDNICSRILRDIGVKVRSPQETVSFLSGGERQSISIGRAVYFGAKLLILDEPTSALSVKEVSKVLDYAREAKNKGLSVIFITHNVEHVYEVADRFVILENGEKLGDYRKEQVTKKDITQMIATAKPI